MLKLLAYGVFFIGAWMLCGPAIFLVAAVFLAIGFGYGLLKGSRTGA